MMTSCVLYCQTSLISEAFGESARKRRMVRVMKEETKMRRQVAAALAALLLVLGLYIVASAQSGELQNPVQSGPTQAGQQNQVLNLQKELDLTPEQIQKWRAIN